MYCMTSSTEITIKQNCPSFVSSSLPDKTVIPNLKICFEYIAVMNNDNVFARIKTLTHVHLWKTTHILKFRSMQLISYFQLSLLGGWCEIKYHLIVVAVHLKRYFSIIYFEVILMIFVECVHNDLPNHLCLNFFISFLRHLK